MPTVSLSLTGSAGATHRILGALLPPNGEEDIDFRQHELVDEVLGADTDRCAAEFVVSTCLLSPPTDRALGAS